MTTEAKQPTLAMGSEQQIDRVRELIVGPHLREYGQRLQDQSRDLERLQQEIARLSEQLAGQEQDQSKRVQTVRQELRDGDETLRSELRATAQQLTTDKMDRSALGELFIELGNQIKAGGSLSNLLADLLAAE
ncbi:MAG: hypothetical protein KBG20_07720 [Caldilineaceae bacterium]|nr:hypothetical protein [Caldilineaceae bacterium]MBP8110175.1 hypothetical protein [Caldilineaceae bacterium]MBP8122700.1 hypothetical protein [Caldilineaceae bacterium]MBP9072170.1 hypothetical protein [Caldilineaceae bacterium]